MTTDAGIRSAASSLLTSGHLPSFKCLVKLCPNRSDEGQFYGVICGPCAGALSGRDATPFTRLRIITSIVNGELQP